MKKIWIGLLALVTVLTMAAPAAGKGKPDKPPKSAPIAVSLEAGPIWMYQADEDHVIHGGPKWVHEADDVIHYTVVIENKTRSEVTVDVLFESDSESAVMVPARATVTLADRFSTLVGLAGIANCESPPPGTDPQCEIPASVTVSYDGGEVVAQTSSEVMPYDPCGFAPTGSSTMNVTGGEACIWQPDLEVKRWTVSVSPARSKPTNVVILVRDHVPGNYCTVPEGGGGRISQRWKPSDGRLTFDVYLGNNGEPYLEEGMCLSGGRGGDYLGVGNAASFYLFLNTDGQVTVSPG